MPVLKHIIFDLDHTLWDFDTNSALVIEELLAKYAPYISPEPAFSTFYSHYLKVNAELWKQYRENQIDTYTLRNTRFRRTFEQLGYTVGNWVEQFEIEYLGLCPKQPGLLPGARELLNTLSPLFKLHLLSNGFTQTQATKLSVANLTHYFDTVITADQVGVKKPDKRIFEFALKKVNAKPEEAIYIGDEYEVDVIGALNAGIRPIFFNPKSRPNPLAVSEVKHLAEISHLLA